MVSSVIATVYNSAAAIVLVFLTYYIIMPVTKIFLTHLIKVKFLSRRGELPNYGRWAVITGATDGIGKAYCESLASDGLNIVLISRSEEKLRTVSKEIEDKYHVQTLFVVADFTKSDIYTDIGDRLQDLDIGVLVNNVGMSYSYPEYFESNSLATSLFTDMINCNVLSTVAMTRLVLPGMVKRAQGGAIINIASASGANPTPLLTVYSASKAFVDFFSRAVGYELLSQGIVVQTVLPFFVVSKLSKFRRASLLVPWPRDYVESALNLLGVESRTYGCLTHSLEAFLLNSLPTFVREWVMWKNVSSTRKMALKRAASRGSKQD